jgi:AbrB family transcriptional regulator (stage V sporulation protein T)
LKSTGIVRRIDDLGRVVLPKEIRRTLRLREGDPLEIFISREGEVVLKKYSPVGELGDFAKEYCDSLYESTGHIALITDRDQVVAVSGAAKKEFLDKPISKAVEGAIEDRKVVLMAKPGEHMYCNGCTLNGNCPFQALVIAPIVSEGDPIGAVILLSRDSGVIMGDLEVKISETAAGFLAKQMES